ncbi:hypothetical protein [Brucella tritici]|uniref:hypothetical protein n=1 Tax=Brucella tritici TaxID=94626 RepID=UPI001592194D|nr:hypothetical protein [Brucella tritici]
MFDDLIRLSPNRTQLIKNLKPVAETEIIAQRAKYPECPDAYWEFLIRFGYGKIKEENEPKNFPAHFEFTNELISAVDEYYKDRMIYDNGAKGDILLFGFDSLGTGFGFDSGDHYAVVRVDEFRIVEKLNIDFENFFLGLLVCYPDFPFSYASGEWSVETGEVYRINQKKSDS